MSPVDASTGKTAKLSNNAEIFARSLMRAPARISARLTGEYRIAKPDARSFRSQDVVLALPRRISMMTSESMIKE